MKHLFLIRHGETDYNRSQKMQGRGIDASLNDLGREQAISVANALYDFSITRVITSSLKRSKETAKPLIESKKVILESYAELDEMSFGDLEGRPFPEVKSNLIYLQDCWSRGKLNVPVPNGETPIEVFKRANSKVLEILKRVDDDYICFILHGRLIRVLLSVWLNLGMENMHHIQHANGSINHITWNGSSFEKILLNQRQHLAESIKQ